MKEKKTTFLIFLIFLSYSFILHGQLAEITFDENPLSVDVNSSKLANSYEYLLKSTLSKYLEKNTYEVDVNVELEVVKKPIKYRTVRINTLGELNIYDDFGDVSESEPVIEDLLLPGTGGRLLSDFIETRDSVIVSEFSSDYKISRMSVFVLLDEAIYTNDEIAFVEDMVRMKTDIDEYRGDIVDVVLQAFPAKRDSEELLPGSTEESLPDPEEQTATQTPPTPTPEPKESILPTIIILAVVFLLLTGLIVLLFVIPKRSQRAGGTGAAGEYVPGGMNIPRYDEQFDTLMDEIRGIRNLSKMSAQPVPAEETEYAKLKSFAVNRFLSDPKNVSLIANSWIENDRENGVEEASRLIKSIDDNLIDLLEQSISAENFRLLSWNVRNMDEVGVKEKVEVLQKFKNAWKALPVSDPLEKESGMFGFLNNLSVYQIKKILQGESDGVKALVLTQIEEDKVGQMLDEMGSEDRAAVLVNMGKLDKVPVSIFKDVSARLSRAALSMSDMKFVTSDGISKVLKVLYNLPIAKQNEYVEEISRTDVQVAEEVVRFFITWDELPELENEILIPAIQKTDRDILSTALIGVSITFSDKVLSILPSRMREMIMSELQVNQARKKPEEIEKARKTLMEIVKKEIWAAGGRKIQGAEDEIEEPIEY